MRKYNIYSKAILSLFSLVIITLLAIPAMAQDSLLINYQGRLTNDEGDPLDTTVMIMFTIYDEGGHYLWGEGQSTTVTSGLFNVILGTVVSLPDAVFSGEDRYLGIKVGADPELSPHTLLTSVPSAAHANHALMADSAVYVERGAGITQLINTGGVELINGYLHFLAIDSINVPDSGYVMCQATMTLFCDHVTGTDARLNIEFRDTTLDHLEEQEFYWFLAPALPTDFYAMPASITRVFAVGPGYNTFHAIGSDFYEAGDTYYVGKIVMTMTYYPMAYGPVQVIATESVGQDLPEKMLLDDLLREELIQRSLHQGVKKE